MRFPDSDILRAFEQDEFFPCFQPLVELRTCKVVGFEVLARWDHGKLGAIPPDTFIPVIERCGLSDRLTRLILAKSFEAAPLLPPDASLSVNLSATQLLDSSLPATLQAAAAQGGFSLHRLTFEITESALVDDIDQSRAVALELKRLGCRLALDDFGTGYSSLKHLNALPFDELKVDRSFVGSMTEKRESRKIVAAVVGLGQSLGLKTVAEGVETQQQANMLFWLGCDIAQGWLYGRAVPAPQLARIISESQRAAPIAVASPFGNDANAGLEALPAQRAAQLQAIYDGAPVGLCFLDRNLRYLSLNRRLAEINGLSAAAHLGRTVAEVIPTVFPLVEPFIRQALDGQPVNGVEIQRPVANEKSAAIANMMSYQPVRDEAGEVVGVSVAIMDITRFRQTETALRESENHYRHMVHLSPHVPWVLDAKGEVVEASPRWESVSGQTLEEALGNGWQKALHPDDLAHTRAAIENALQNGVPIDIEYRVHRPDGEWVWMRSRGAPRFDASDKVVSIYGVLEEVDLHKQISDELEICHTELKAALNAVQEGILLVDARDARIFMVNPAAKDILGGAVFPGQTLAEYTLLRLWNAKGEPLQKDQFPIVRATLHGESVNEMQLFFEKADGSRVPLSVSGKPIHSDNGQQIGGLLVIRKLDGETPPRRSGPAST